MKKSLLCCLVALLPLQSQAAGDGTITCPQVRIVPERLADLNIPRHSNHVVYCQNGELTIFGGHTTGFVLTPTAEYYSGGAWHLMPMTYNHDMGLCVRLRSGKVLLGGGATQNLGIGQSFETEVYDPLSHTFSRYGCLDKKRFHSAGLELDSGRAVIAGNWYTNDGIEQYDTLSNTFTFVKDVAQQRSHPFIFRTAKDNVIIVSGIGERADTLFSPIVDQLKGEPFSVPLFETWTPIYPNGDFFSDDCFIGDEARGEYAYLMPVMNRARQVTIAQVRDTVFTLLPTASPVPQESPWGPIHWFCSILVDRQAHRGYLMGSDGNCRQFFLAIDYASEPAGLTLYYTDPMPDAGAIQPVMSPDGDLYVVGGVNAKGSYFTPLGSVLLYRFGSQEAKAESQGTGHPWLWIVLTIVVILAVLALLRPRLPHSKPPLSSPKGDTEASPLGRSGGSQELMQRIITLMEEQKPYLDSNLKMQDVAAQLGIHQNDVSACINANRGYSFSQFVNIYRVAYAQQLLREHPEKKMSQVGLESGFANDTSFFRSFKAITGLTPSEWLKQLAK